MSDRTHPDSGPGAVYAALPDIDEDNGLIWQAIFDWKDCERGAPALAAADRLSRLLADQMRAFADATCELRAAHGQAPASKIEGLTAAQESLGAEFEKVLHDNLFDLYEESPHTASHGQAPAQAAPAYKDSTPELHIGDSAFESWYSSYSPAHKSDKQRVRDAYAAGMGDPLVTAAPAAVAGPREAVAYLDIGTGGYLDIGTDLAYEALSRLPKGRHVLVIAGTYGIDGYTAAPTTQPAHQQEPSYTSVQLAEMVLSDCGHSSNYTPLLDRVAARIDAHVERRLDELRGCLESNPAPSPAAQGDALSDDAVRVPLDSLHADAAYLIGRLREGSMPYARVIEIIRERIDAAKAAIRARAAQGDIPDVVDVPDQCPYFGPSPHRDVWLAGWYAARAAQESK